MKFLGNFVIAKKITTAFLSCITVLELMGAPLLVILFTPQVAKAAEVAISTTPNTTAANHTTVGSNVVFIDDQVGYRFFKFGAAPSNNMCGYSKTTNGGNSWGTFVPMDTQTDCIGMSVWYDKWTPGDSGSFIHLVTIDTSADEMYYNRLDTTNDSQLVSSSITTCPGCSGTYVSATNNPTITKATNGTVYVVTDDGNGTNIRSCSSNCGVSGSWSAVGTNPQGNADTFSLLAPLASGNVLLVNRSTANVLRFSVWNGTNWSSMSTIDAAAVLNTSYDSGLALTVDIDNNDVYVAYVTDNDTFTVADHDIRTTKYNGSSWTNLTDVLTNTAGRGIHQVAIARDQNNGDIYVTYTVRPAIGTAVVNVYYKSSSDGMSTWGSEQGPLNATAADLSGITTNLSAFERIYASWYDPSVTDIMGETVADIGPDVELSSIGTQISQTRDDVVNVYAGGAFALSARTNRTVTSVILNETGSINAQTALNNIKLFYEYDTADPYDCASVLYNGTENQFGATVSNFSGADGYATYSVSPLAISSTSTMCLYVTYEVDVSAINGDTIDIRVEDASTDVIVSGITVFPAGEVVLASSTTVVSPDLTQYGYHWRLDDGNETGATSATGGVENTSLSAVQIGSGRRVRIGVANQGSTSTLSSTYELEYGEAAPTCEDVGSWIRVGETGAAWLMRDSTFVTDGNSTTDIGLGIGGITNLPSTNLLTPNTALKDTSATTSSLVFDIDDFVEFEYSVVATTSASEGSTYCFRMVQGGTPLTIYSEYPRATIAADVQVQSFGTQITAIEPATTTIYLGGGFSLKENSASRLVTDITLLESGSIDSAVSLDNVGLYYDLDTTNPYDCSSESYVGTESQFGTTSINGFSDPGETVTFSDSVLISTTSTMCLYLISDIAASAQNGETIDISINSPAVDVVVSGGSVGPSTPINITGSTTIEGAVLDQIHFHWRNNNGSETGATSATGGSQDTTISDFALSTPIRLRLAVTNSGLAASVPTRFALEYAPKISTCENATVWTDVNSTADGWDMYDSGFLTNGETTTDLAIGDGGVGNGVGSFVGSNGGVRDTEDLSGTTTIPINDYIDLEYSITSTALTSYGTTFCFRVSSYDIPLNTYSSYAEITTSVKRDFKIQRGSSTVSGTSALVLAGDEYTAPASTSRAFVRITNTYMTGAGKGSGGNRQNTDDTSAYISNPANIGTSFTIARPATAINDTHVDWEIIEFIGAAETDNEIVVREVGTISFSSSALNATTSVISGVANDNKVVVYITGIQNQGTVLNYYSGQVTSLWNDGSDQAVFSRGASGAAALEVSYAVVEFVGNNWNIQRVEHSFAAATGTEAIAAVNSLAHTFLHTQKRMGAVTDVKDHGHEVRLSGIGNIYFELESDASLLVEQTSVAWVIENTQTSLGEMKVQRSSGNTTGGSESLALSIILPIPISALNNTSISGNSRAAGANTNHPRSIAGLFITSTSSFQIWRSDTGSLLTYQVELIEWPIADLSIRQNYYRFYVDNNDIKPDDPWPAGFTDLGENTTITASDEPLGTGDKIRVRMTLRTSNANMPAGFVNFKLQYSLRATTCSAIDAGSWSDVGNLASSTVWRGFAATGTSDGTSLSLDPPTPGDLLISVANVSGSLVHENPSVANPYVVTENENIEYDWHLEHNGAIPLATYCFRTVRSDGTPLEGYSYYPQIKTAGFTPVTKNWRWYADPENETPVSPLAGENVSPIDVANTDTLAIRVSVYEKRNVQGDDVKFKLQFSDDITFANPIDVVSTTSCVAQSLWCYEQGGGADNALISTSTLSDADSCIGGVGTGCGRHNVSADLASGHIHYGFETREYSFTIRNAAARVKAVYYFRLYDVTNSQVVITDIGESQPSLITEGPTLTLTLAGLPSGTTTAGVVTDITTSPDSIGYGDMDFNTEYIAAHRISVETNATEGYQVLKFARQQLISSGGAIIPSISGTNATPTSWVAGCNASSTGCVGYHATDPTLRNGSTRFVPDDSYSALETNPAEVMYSSIPASNTHDIVYRIRVNELQPAGLYETEIVYLAVPSY